MASSSKETKYKNTCYWCGQPATTREHVPPRSFFPDILRLQTGLAMDQFSASLLGNTATIKPARYPSFMLITSTFERKQAGFCT